MKKLSKQLESKIMQAIEKTAALVNTGEHPNDAIVKAAEECGIPPGSVNLMVHAYNTGRTSRQREIGEGTWEKAADFELADAAEVVAKLYPDRVKTSAELRHDTAVSTEYAISPTGLLERRASREKQARQLDWGLGAATPDPYPGEPATAMKRASAQVDRARREAAEVRRQANAAFDKAASTFDDLTEYFRSPGCQPIPVVRENVLLLHGNHGERVMDELIRIAPGLAKMANHRQAVPAMLPPAQGRPYELVNRLFTELAAYHTLAATSEKTAAAAQQQAEVLLRPFALPAAKPSVLSGLSLTDLSEKQAFGTAGKVGLGMGLGKALDYASSSLKAPETKSLMQGKLQSLNSPDHLNDLRKVRVQSMLQDMLLNDDVISGYDPQDALTAYNEIVDMAPPAADKKLLLQTLMRKRLTQGALDPFEVDQLLGMAGKLRTLNQPAQMPAGVAADGSVL